MRWFAVALFAWPAYGQENQTAILSDLAMVGISTVNLEPCTTTIMLKDPSFDPEGYSVEERAAAFVAVSSYLQGLATGANIPAFLVEEKLLELCNQYPDQPISSLGSLVKNN